MRSIRQDAETRRDLPREISAAHEIEDGDAEVARIVGESKGLTEALDLARRLAPTDLPLLLVGETGTGKELFAQEIHRWSRRSGQLVDVNCAALPRDMVESLLFGHRRGAFTGALEHSRGLVEEADNGTLFLDEILSMPLEAQAKLLRTLETGEVRRLGETSKRTVSVRTVAACQGDYGERVRNGHFRADLLQRLAGAVMRIPPLRQRGDDVVLLAGYFASRRGLSLGRGATEVLHGYAWPGNVRELRFAIERASILAPGHELTARALADSISLGAMLVTHDADSSSPERRLRDVTVRDRVVAVCAANGWNAARSAQALGLGRTTLFKQLKVLGISLRDGRSSVELRLRRTIEPRVRRFT